MGVRNRAGVLGWGSSPRPEGNEGYRRLLE
jgi:hypothetical protein